MVALDLSSHPIIAAVRELDDVSVAANSPVRVVFLMTGDALSVGQAVETLQRAGKQVVVHIDLIRGVAPDKAGVQFLARTAHPDGIVSTKLHVLQAARKERLAAVQHIFVIDTQAYETGVRHTQEFGPDAIELMPGLMPRVIADFRRAVPAPILGAGLIRTYAEVQRALEAGAAATVVGLRDLWSLELQ